MKVSGQGTLTYPFPGRTRAVRKDGDSAWPEGYDRVRRRSLVGHGEADYHALADGIAHWGIQRGAGLSIDADERVRAGARVVCGFGIGALRLPVPCEVVWTEDASAVLQEGGAIVPQWAGFGYGSLPGHPESGEEAFVASIDADGAVHFEVIAFSRPASLLFRLGGPVARRIQRHITVGYLQAARSLVRNSTYPALSRSSHA